jgi:hypothetical protein
MEEVCSNAKEGETSKAFLQKEVLDEVVTEDG